MCFGGTNDASDAASAQAEEQQASINSNVQDIQQAFAGRQTQYNNYLDALNTSYQTQLNLQQSQASRGLKFALARGGLTGSSVAADQGGELQREMGQGTVTAEEQAQAKLAGLQSSDQAEKQQMIALAQSGAGVGNIGEQTATGLEANLNNAQSNLGPNTLGSVFGGISNDVTSMNLAAQTRMGLRAAQAYTSPFSNSATTNSGFAGGAL